VLGNTGTLVKTGYTFAGWNTAANGSGSSYSPGNTFAMGGSNVTLYARWTENTYTVTYNGNSNTGGSAPTDGTSYHNGDTATVLGNTGTLVRTGYTFAGWNTAANGSGTSYIGGDTFAIGTSNVTLYAQWTAINYTVTYNGNTNTGGSVPTDGNTYNITNTVTVLGNTGTLTKTGYTFAGWNTAANGSGSSYNGGSTFAMGNSDVTLYARWTVASGGGGGSASPDTGMPASTPPAGQNVIINGQEQQAGTLTQTTNGDVTTATVFVNESMINQQLTNLVGTANNNILVPINAVGADVLVAAMPGSLIATLAANNFNISVQSGAMTYTVPAEQISMSSLAQQLGAEGELGAITVAIGASPVSAAQLATIQAQASLQQHQILFPPTSLTITASFNGNSVVVENFTNYVPRIMAIPPGIDPSMITTGVVCGPDGTMVHIPTVVFQEGGVWYARANSLTNSVYTVIFNPAKVPSVANHWSQKSVNDMAARLVISNPDFFDPRSKINRGVFAEYITKALGIYRQSGGRQNQFRDVPESHPQAQAIAIAVEYGLIKGYSDGRFLPQQTITREEAMAMYARAMRLAKVSVVEIDRAKHYRDFSEVSDWAKGSVQEAIGAEVFNGTSATTISPKANITYAEAVSALRNLLLKAGLIGRENDTQ
jgi:uncharacterized repeat protein (TIGR02543 family)